MKIDVLVAEIGSTTTVVNAFQIHQKPICFLGRGISRTSVETDVREGLDQAIDDLRKNLNVSEMTYGELYASSSAAGGLKITVHGLVYEMTAKAAKEAALNAGGNIHLITANRLEKSHIENIKALQPNIIIISGGTDYGEKEVAYLNLLDVKDLGIPIIYTGNIANHDRIKQLNQAHIKLVDNVYPRVDDYHIMPLREAIYQTFEEHIIHAKGMKDIFKMVNHGIIPTPGAVMETTLMLYDLWQGVMTIDVGGATTDIHSVCEPRQEFKRMLEGEPLMKRTVEGDLGVYINRKRVLDTYRKDDIKRYFPYESSKIDDIITNEPFIPQTEEGKHVIDILTNRCVELALDRHIGDLKRVFTTNGYKVIPEGKDVRDVKVICLTGGALLYGNDKASIIKDYIKNNPTKLVPDQEVSIYKDQHYIFASLGVLSRIYPQEAKILLNETMMKVG